MENHNKLDVAAKIFPAVTNKNNSSVFRVSVILKEEIDPHCLQLAVNMIHQRFFIFFMRLRKGVFWNHFDKNYFYFKVSQDLKSPCQNILSYDNDGYIIRVLYYKNRISVEAFHSITDGSGVFEFLKSLIYYYICIKHHEVDSQDKVILFDERTINDFDSYAEHFSNLSRKSPTTKIQKGKIAFRLKGKRFKHGGICVVSGVTSVSSIKKHCKEQNCTITAFLIANMIATIYECKQRHINDKKPIVIAVPVNLRALFPSNTLKNFFGVVNIGHEVNELTEYSEIIKSVTEQLKSSLDPTNLSNASAKNVRLSKNVFSAHTPLILKDMVLPIGFNIAGEYKKTISISNVGKFDVPDDIKPYIEHIEVMLYPTPKSPINCGVCSFEDKLVISFSRAITDVEVVKKFFVNISKKFGSEVAVYSNDWGEDYEKM